MEIVKAATEWAKAEVFSSMFFIAFGILFISAGIGFWQLGKTELAQAYIIPALVAGILLLAIGLGLYFTNKSRISSFPEAYQTDASAFVASEIVRVEKALGEYRNIVFKVIPFILIAAALLIFFTEKPIWRATAIVIIGMMCCIMLIDSNANARLTEYRGRLEEVKGRP